MTMNEGAFTLSACAYSLTTKQEPLQFTRKLDGGVSSLVEWRQTVGVILSQEIF